MVVLYSAIGQNRTEYIRVPIPAGSQATVTDYTGSSVTTSVVPVPFNASVNTLVFEAFIPAAGFSTYFIEFSSASQPASAKANPQTISNQFYTLTFDSDTGRLTTIQNVASGVMTNLDQTFGYFVGSDGNTPWYDSPRQASGAYIFRPDCPEDTPIPTMPLNVTNGSVSLTITAQPGVQEAYQVFADWLTQTIRLYDNQNFIEVSWTVGPVPFHDGLGKEVVSIWNTDLQVNQTWYTDSNGRDMQQRRFNYRPTWDLVVTDPISLNFFPVDSSIYMQENFTDGRQFVINTDRAEGGGSLKDGQLLLMVHRRLLHDDSRGVGEPLNETGTTGLGLVVTGTQRVTLDTVANSPLLHKWNTRRLTFPPTLSFTPLAGSVQDYINNNVVLYSALNEPLPVNIHLLTVQDNSILGDNGTMILRLDHSFEVGEDPVYSQPVTVDIEALFTHLSLTACTEMTLTANAALADVQRFDWKTEADSNPESPFVRTKEEIKASRNAFEVTISPMQIRTWLCDYNRV